MTLVKYFTIIFLCLISFCTFAQDESFYIDSLKQDYVHAKNDTLQAKLLNKISRYYEQANLDSAFKYANTGLILAKRMQWEKGIAAFYTSFGNTYSNKGKLDSALFFYNKSLALYIKIKDTLISLLLIII